MTNSTKEPKKTAPSKAEGESHAQEKNKPAHESRPKAETSHAHTDTHAHGHNHHTHAKHSAKSETFAEKFAAAKVELRKKVKSLIHKLDKLV